MIARLSAAFRVITEATIAIAIACLLLSILGSLIRDRWVTLSLLMYLPGLWFAVSLLLVDIARRGRTLRGPRFMLTGIAIVAMLLESPWVVGLSRADAADPQRTTLRLVQWNVLWGRSWESAMGHIEAQSPDVVVLSESPWPREDIEQLRKRLGDDWQLVAHDSAGPPAMCTTRVRVLSRYPLRLEKVQLLPLGSAAITTIETPTGPVRLLTADGLSGFHHKTPFLTALAAFVEQNQPIDLIAGDFNALNKSQAFESIARQGYREASTLLGAVRPTWPCVVPVFDIDQVFGSGETRLLATNTFGGVSSDHRGTLAVLQPPSATPPVR